MTSVVKVDAHCSDNKEVVVKVFDSKTNAVKEEVVLQNGQSTTKHIYDDLVVACTERLKADDSADEDQSEPEADEQGDAESEGDAADAGEQAQQ